MRDINPRTRAILLLFIAWPIFGLGMIWMSLKISEWIMVLLVLGLFLFQKAFMTICCVHCGKPVGWNKLKIIQKLFGLTVFWWTPFIPKYCSSCGRKYKCD